MSKISTVNQVKEHNIALVRDVIHSSVEFTKHSIAQATGLSIATTNSILNTLCKAGEIVAIGNVSSTIGRPAAKYAYNRDYAHICCVFPSSAGSQRYLFYSVFDLLGSSIEQNQVWLEDVTYESFEELVGSLLEKDPALARQAIVHGAQVDEKEKQIERRCLRLLLQQQPVAADLRMISTALKMITDMERIGDQAEDISEIAIRLINDGYAGSLEHIPQMAWATVRMVTGAVDAFVARDLDRARAVVACDDIVDDLFNQVRDDLVRLIREEMERG